MSDVFAEIFNNFEKKAKEAQVLSDASNKLLNEQQREPGESYDMSKDEMGVKNMGWDTMDFADIAGGVEESRDLTSEEEKSFWQALSQFLGED